MNIRKPAIISAVAVLVLLILVLVSFSIRKPFAHETKQTTEITLTDGEFVKVIQSALKDRFPLKDLSVDISQDGTIHLAANIQKDDLNSVLQKQNIPLHYTLALLPDEIPVRLDFCLDFSENSLVFSPVFLEISGIELTRILTQDFVDAINKKLNEQIQKYIPELLSVKTLYDSISIQFRR